MAEEGEIPCTFKSCRLVFKSASDMQHHKANADGHSYCMKCDLDLPTHQALHLHKIMSDRHFACPECCLELRSEAGLEVHMRNNHRESRQVVCVGCGSKYKSASAVIKHIEDKQCPVLSLPEKARDGANYDLHTGSLLTMGRVSPGPQLAHSGDSSEDEDTDGGVSLNPSSADVKGKGPSREADMISLPCDDWPDLAAPATPWKKKSGSTSTDSPGGVLLDDLVESSMPIPSPFPLKSDENSSNLPQAGSSTYTGPSHQRTSIHRHIQGVDPEHFWNSEKGRYFCNCGASFLYVTTFKYHLTMEDETINDCPRCFKRFVSLAALVAHMEARWSKCAVRVCTGQIEQELSEVTQGLADIPRHYTESELDALDIEMSSQPGRNSPGSSIAEGVSSIAETISADARSIPGHMGARFAQSDAGFPYSDPIDARVPTSLSDPGMFFSYSETDSIPAETEPFEEGSMVESMVEDLRGLVFASSDDDLEEEL